MFETQIHLGMNHFPIAGIVLSLPFLLFGILKKNDHFKLSGALIVIIAAITGAIVFSTGEGAEDTVKSKAGVTKELIHEHEEAGEAALIVLSLAGLLSIAYIVMNKKNHPLKDKLAIALFVLAIFGSGAILKTAHDGGKIRHEEIR